MRCIEVLGDAGTLYLFGDAVEHIISELVSVGGYTGSEIVWTEANMFYPGDIEDISLVEID